MGLIKIILFLILTTIMAIFAFANREPVILNLVVFDDSINLPLYLVILVSFAAGIIVCGIAASINQISYHRANVINKKRIKALETEVDALKADRRIKSSL